MMVKSFLAWMEQAPPRERAEAVQILAETYLSGALGGEDPEEVEVALTMILDDPSPLVRRALALAFAERADVPRHIALSLANDQSEVSALLVARSPLLTEADLVDLVMAAEGLALIAIALRSFVSERVSQGVILRANLDANLALITNPQAEIADADLITVIEQHGQIAAMREALLKRDSLPASARHRLMVSLANELGGYATQAGFVSSERNGRMIEDTIQTGTLVIAHREVQDLAGFVVHLRESGKLTPALLLRSLLCGHLALMQAAIVELSGLDSAKVGALLHSTSNAAVSALVRRAGFPQFLEPVLIVAMRAAARFPAQGVGADLSRPIILEVMAVSASLPGEQGIKLTAMLRRYEAEAARAASRRIADQLRSEARAELVQLASHNEALLLTHEAKAPVATPAPVGISQVPSWADDDLFDGDAPAVPAHAEDAAPDLRTVISEWKREREARSAAFEASRYSPSQSRAALEDEIHAWRLRSVA